MCRTFTNNNPTILDFQKSEDKNNKSRKRVEIKFKKKV